MRSITKVVPVLALLFHLGLGGCSGSLTQRIGLEDLPQSPFQAARYTSGSKSLVVILDDPDDSVALTFAGNGSMTTQEGLKTAEEYLPEFNGTPKAYRLQDRADGKVLGYLMISAVTPRELEWLVHYDRDRRLVVIWVDSPFDNAGGEPRD